MMFVLPELDRIMYRIPDMFRKLYI